VVPVRSRRGDARHHTVAAAAVTRSPARSGCSQLAAEVDVVEGVGAMARGGSPHHHGWQAEVVPHAAQHTFTRGCPALDGDQRTERGAARYFE